MLLFFMCLPIRLRLEALSLNQASTFQWTSCKTAQALPPENLKLVFSFLCGNVADLMHLGHRLSKISTLCLL